MTDSILIASKLLQELAEQLKNLTPDEIQNVADGNAKLILMLDDKPVRRSDKPSSREGIAEAEKIAQQLRSLETREEGMQLLRESFPTKAALAQLMKLLDLPLSKSDSVDRLQERIVETTIGYRLRSKAIQNHAVDRTLPSAGKVA